MNELIFIILIRSMNINIWINYNDMNIKMNVS